MVEYVKNREYYLKKFREYRLEHIDKYAAYDAERWRGDPERRAQNKRATARRRQKTRRVKAAQGKIWEQKNPDKVRSKRHKRRAKKMFAEGSFSDRDIQDILSRQKNNCFWCKNPIQVGKHSADHYIPLNRGGTNWPSNIVVACHSCNSKKGDKLPYEFRKYLKEI